MTVANTTTLAGPFALNGVTLTFPYGFRILDAAETEFVKIHASDGEIEVLSGYSVTGVGESDGGNVVFSVAPSGGTGFFRRKGAMTQPLGLTNYGPFFAESVTRALDRMTMYLLEGGEEIGRSLRGAIGETWAPAPPAAFRASKVLTFDASGNLDFSISTADVSTIAGMVDEIAALNAISSEIIALYALGADIETVASIESAVAALGPIAASIEGVSAIAGSVLAVAGNAANINAVAGMSDDIALIVSYGPDLHDIAEAVEVALDGALIPSDIGVTVQGYQSDYARLSQTGGWSAVQTYTGSTQPIVINGTNQDAKLKFQHAGTDAGFIGANATNAFHIINAANAAVLAAFPNAGGMTLGGQDVLTAATGARLAAANNFTANLSISSTNPYFYLNNSNGGTNQKRWADHVNSSGTYRLLPLMDNGSEGTLSFSITQSGGVPVLVAFATPVQARAHAGSTTSGTLVLADAESSAELTGNITVPANVFAAGTKIRRYMGSSARTITQGSLGTQRLSGSSTTGNLTGGARGWILIEFISTTEWTITGDVY